MGYVYVMEAPKLGKIKIGISEHDVHQRQKSVQTGCPEKIERCWCSRNIPDFIEIEKELHSIFKSKNSSGEWFNLDFNTAVLKADKLCKEGVNKETKRLIEENAEIVRKCNDLIFENQKLKEEITELEKRIECQYKQLQKSFTEKEITKAIHSILLSVKRGNDLSVFLS